MADLREPPAARDATGLDEAIELVLSNPAMRRSEQLRRLLVYLGQAAKDPDPSLLSETAIGVRVFGRADFNPKIDTIVRSEMLRLRRKLDELYAEAGEGVPLRIGFERNSYRPVLVPNSHLEPEHAALDTIPAATGRTLPPRAFWTGLVAGAAGMAALTLVIMLSVRTGSVALPAEVREHPLWRGFHNAEVDVLVGTPLFFRNRDGFERSFKLNTPEDLPRAEERLARWPAFPYWDLWSPYDNLPTALLLDHTMAAMGSRIVIVPGRERSIGNLAGRRTIVVGQPRFVPLLADLLADQDFRPSLHTPGDDYYGILNHQPRPGERAIYVGNDSTLVQQSDENMEDYGLVTSLQLEQGGQVLSVFGDRVQSASFLTRALLEPRLLKELSARVFTRPNAAYKSAQVVFRIDYNKGKPIGTVYVAHRIRY